MCMEMIDMHNALSPALTKIELYRLSPVMDTDRETVATLGLLLLEMVQDYARALRQTLDDLTRGEVRP
jgi:hypothetical protein